MSEPSAESSLPTVTDAEMETVLQYAQPYSIVILRTGPQHDSPDATSLLREHNRRNLALRAAGELAVVLRIDDDSDVTGVNIFDRDVPTTTTLVNDDPAVQAGVLAVEIHPGHGFPGDSLPPEPD
ncbi:hypothetical protein GCM10009624_26090 [Gordonia sinesedis]